MKSNRCEVAATYLDEAGAGVGPALAVASGDAGLVVHVADLLPGERAEVMIDHGSPHRREAWGRVIRRIGDPSPDRVAAACPAFGSCGGCVWQQLAYEAQLVAKRARVRAALAAVPVVARGTVEVAAVRPSPAIVGYRNKGKYVAGRAGDHLVLGAYAPRTHRVIDTLGCKVVAPVIDEVATWTRGAADAAGMAAYDEVTRAGELRYVIIRESGGDVLVALVVASGTSRTRLVAVAAQLEKHPAVSGVVVVVNDRRDGAILPASAHAEVLAGDGTLIEDFAGTPVDVGAGEFVQVNRAQSRALYARVAELADAQPGSRAVDLFAGLGGIGLTLARAGARVVAVEIDREAVARLRTAATTAQLPVSVIGADAGAAADLEAEIRAALGAQPPEVVVVNPPRKGLSTGARALVVALAAPTVIYVSCGPDALGRDLIALGESGYSADVIEPFDLMPSTAQIETIVRLRRTPSTP